METITRYACALCRHEFPTQHEAQACEAKGVPEARFEIGDDAEIEIENNLSLIWSYGWEDHKIEDHKIVMLNDGSHAIAYGFNDYWRKRYALVMPGRGNGLFSAYNW